MKEFIIILGIFLAIGYGIKYAYDLLCKKIDGVPKIKSNDTEDYTNYYQKKWLFSFNEKDAYKRIKQVTDKLGLTVFAKVRLYDLVEPKQGLKNFKAAQWKIQAKHVDFVICDTRLAARAIIELDDSSHDTEARAERDTFVDAVLTKNGYKVIRIRYVIPEQLESELKEFVE